MIANLKRYAMRDINLKHMAQQTAVKLLHKVNKFICFFIGHFYKVVSRSNGDMWGWNNLECKRCKHKSDTLTS